MNFHLIRGKNSSKSSQKALDLTNLKKCFYGVMVFLLAPVLREKCNFTYYLGGMSFKTIVHPFWVYSFLNLEETIMFFVIFLNNLHFHSYLSFLSLKCCSNFSLNPPKSIFPSVCQKSMNVQELKLSKHCTQFTFK